MRIAPRLLVPSIALILAGCGGDPPVHAPTADGTSPLYETIDWCDLADRLPRTQLAWYNKHFGDFERDPAAVYRRALRFDAPWDSLGAEDFGALPGAERAWRREAARDLVRQAFLGVADRAYRLRDCQERGRLAVGPLNLLFRVLPRTLQRLHTAVGTDPTSTAAWTHLAFFSGVAGDRGTAATARRRSLALLAPGDGRRPRLILDEAWDLREAGRFQAVHTWLAAHAAELAAAPAPGRDLAPADESQLVGALCLAELGDVVAVRQAVFRLPRIEIEAAGGSRETDALRSWVQARSALATGDRDLSVFHLGIRRVFHLPPSLAWRYWQDLGLIFESLGEMPTARRYWSMAYGRRLFLGFFPQVSVQAAGSVLGRPDTDQPFVLAFRRFFLVGSLWSYAATRALVCQACSPAEDPWLWDEAFRSLGACIRRGIHERDARLLRARLSIQIGDLEAACADLEARAVQGLTGHGDQAELAFLGGVARLNGGDLAGSIPELERAVAMRPDYLRAWQALAVASTYRGDMARAEFAFLRADELEPDDGINAFNRGLFYLQLGRDDEAEACLARAARLLPDRTRPLRLLQALNTGQEVVVDTEPQPVRLVASDAERQLARSLDRLVDGDLATIDIDDVAGDDPEARAVWLELVERAYAEDPAAVNRLTLGRAWLDADRAEEVTDLLAPGWPALDAAEACLLLEADRRLGEIDRARAVAIAVGTASVAPGGPPTTVPVLVRAVTILLDHGHRAEAAAVVAAIRREAPDEPALDALVSRLGSS